MSRVIFKQNCVICVQKNTSNLSFVYTAVEDDLNLPVVPVFVLTTIDDSTRRNVEQYRLIIPKIRRKVDHFKRKARVGISVSSRSILFWVSIQPSGLTIHKSLAIKYRSPAIIKLENDSLRSLISRRQEDTGYSGRQITSLRYSLSGRLRLRCLQC
ncbi:hypothetical protein M8J75_015772 [Diaphorina citri]|nr:hypothetical protein M8J75_015772 [Diaphorina citri]KAI5742450.1 hypothetical protein M8J77_007334 [Diaphorina citri]